MRQLLVVGLALVAACAPGQLFRRGSTPNVPVEAQYDRALSHLDPTTPGGSLDTAITFLDAYLAHGGYVQHRREAATLRVLAAEARQLANVQAALREARANVAEVRTSDGEVVSRASETVREVQRLRDELAKANAELERIRKRLAQPKP